MDGRHWLGLDYFTESQNNPGGGKGEQSGERSFPSFKKTTGQRELGFNPITAIRGGERNSPVENSRVPGWQGPVACCPWGMDGRVGGWVDGHMDRWTCR